MTAVFIGEQPTFVLAARRIKKGKVKSKRKSAPKVSKASVLRSWGIPEVMVKWGTGWLRYKNPIEKGIYWYFLSLKVRKRDVEQWGTCISCGKPITIETSDAGHFIPAASCGRDLLFDERNVNAECSHCNAWDEMHLFGYGEGLDKRYGEGTARELRMRYLKYKNGEPVRDWSKAEYELKIKELL